MSIQTDSSTSSLNADLRLLTISSAWNHNNGYDEAGNTNLMEGSVQLTS